MGLLQSAEFKVGLMVVLIASLIGYMSMQVSSDPSYMGRSKRAWFLLNDAGGLIKNSAVKTAGISVGIIRDIRLQDGKARIDLTIRPEMKLKVTASVEVRSVGILGDKYIELTPGADGDPDLPDNAQILNVKDNGSLSNVISQVGDITGSLKNVAKTLEESVQDDGTRKHILGRIVSNIEKLTGDLAQVTGDNKEKVNEIVDQVNGITKTLNEIVNEEGEGGLKSSLKKATASLARLEPTLKNIEEISAKINNGEGTIGKLVNDDTTIEELNGAISGVSDYLDTAGKMSTAIDFHTDYLGVQGQMKTFAGIRIQPGLDRYYLIQFVDDPQGYVDQSSTTTTTGGVSTTTATSTTYKSKLKLTALFAKNFYDFTVRAGIMENSAGLGIDYRFFRNRMKFVVDAFNFSQLNLRPSIQYQFRNGIYLVGGYNDLLNKNSVQSGYFGLGLFLTNDDLKIFASKMSF